VAERRVAPVSNDAINKNIAGKSHHLLREKSVFIFYLLYMFVRGQSLFDYNVNSNQVQFTVNLGKLEINV
jgi:hypothetical protein